MSKTNFIDTDPLAQKPKPDPVRFTFYDLDGHVIESKGIN